MILITTLFSLISEEDATLSFHWGNFICCHCSYNNVGTTWHYQKVIFGWYFMWYFQHNDVCLSSYHHGK
jgi:hypothetical protein